MPAHTGIAAASAGGIEPFAWQLSYHHAAMGASEMFYRSVVEPRAVPGVSVNVW